LEESIVQRLRDQSIAIQLIKDSGDAQLFSQLCKFFLLYFHL
jgi:hypothetical protein